MRPLNSEVWGDGPRLVLAHGFTQTARSWGEFGRKLGASHTVVSVDLPGHGGSADVRADLVEGGLALLDAGGSEPFDLVGYSLGARMALHGALARPGVLRRLVLIGATAGIADDAARASRRARDEAMADDLERTGDVAGFVDRWLAQPMFAHLPDPGRAERLRNDAAGLASSLRLAGTGTQAPLWNRLSELDCPVLALAGATDTRFALAATRLAHGVRAGWFSLVPGAGHAAHLAQPDLVSAIVTRFVA